MEITAPMAACFCRGLIGGLEPVLRLKSSSGSWAERLV